MASAVLGGDVQVLHTPRHRANSEMHEKSAEENGEIEETPNQCPSVMLHREEVQ